MDAGLLGDHASDSDQHGVAGRVAVLQVQVAKPVDIEQGHGQRALVAVGARDVELELGPESSEAEQARRERVPLGEPGQLPLEPADPLPSSHKLLGQVLTIPHSHLGLTIGSLVTLLDDRLTRGGGPTGPEGELGPIRGSITTSVEIHESDRGHG